MMFVDNDLWYRTLKIKIWLPGRSTITFDKMRVK